MASLPFIWTNNVDLILIFVLVTLNASLAGFLMKHAFDVERYTTGFL